LFANNLTIAEENSIDTLDSSSSCDESAERSVSQEREDRLIRGFSWLSGRYLYAYSDNGDWIGRPGPRTQVVRNYGFNVYDRSQSDLFQPKVTQRCIPSESTVAVAGARRDYNSRSNINPSSSMRLPVVLLNAQRNAKHSMHNLFHNPKWLFGWPGMNASRSESWNGGRS
jgi:hypothetical protein